MDGTNTTLGMGPTHQEVYASPVALATLTTAPAPGQPILVTCALCTESSLLVLVKSACTLRDLKATKAQL